MNQSRDPMATSSKKIRFDESESESEEEEDPTLQERGVIERELADVTFEELQKARSNGSELVYRKIHSEKKSSRANKNRPMEVSAKKPVSRHKEIIQAPKKVIRDPRFEMLCGNFEQEGFRKRYNFLYENDFPAEKEELKKEMKKSNDPEVIADIKNRLSWIDKQLKTTTTAKQNDKEVLSEHKKKEREAAKQGKKPYYLKKSEIRKQSLIGKFTDLKESGKLDAYIDKRRKKNATKDHRYMPYRRPGNNEQ
ncbi:ribosomal RNA processing protein 36 homolog [Impatiens glandulifera]|uniref:ribosomal RNA processing protein 36 homolog n=1 Tax=Impatiens glandulifera TaxID=253017 RepID=UPI001FB08900|nr:ribosomal RNA processing protein 36 homolog [Impatiens glandulifera]